MTDTDKLKRLAEACSGDDKIIGLKLSADEARKYSKAILDLIAENERLGDEEGLKLAAYDRVSAEIEHSNRLAKERDEAVALLRSVARYRDQDLTHNISIFLARIDAANKPVA